jgi:hypothetical protein
VFCPHFLGPLRRWDAKEAKLTGRENIQCKSFWRLSFLRKELGKLGLCLANLRRMSATDGFPSGSTATDRSFSTEACKLSRCQPPWRRCVSVEPRQVDLCQASSSCRPTTFASCPDARRLHFAPRSPSRSPPAREGYDRALLPRDHSFGRCLPWECGTAPARKLERVKWRGGRELPQRSSAIPEHFQVSGIEPAHPLSLWGFDRSSCSCVARTPP